MSEWISVKDRLPDNKYAVKLIWISRFNYSAPYIGLGVYRDGRWDYPDANGHNAVIFWHELPELPE
jgi:hypothetical protein